MTEAHFCEAARIMCNLTVCAGQGCVEVEIQKITEAWNKEWVDPELSEEDKKLLEDPEEEG